MPAIKSSVTSTGLAKPPLWQIPNGAGVDAIALKQKSEILKLRLTEIAQLPGVIKIANSLSAEDVLLLHHWLKQLTYQTRAEIFVLETGRLPPATLTYITTLENYFACQFRLVRGDATAIARYVEQYGLNGFYDSLAARKACCHVRKVLPLQTILAGASAWLTGQRQGQSVTRGQLSFQEKDDNFGLIKFNPIFDWQEAEVFAYLKTHAVPLHPLYAKGYASIGCDPCSRAIKATESIRAGRWWWEAEQNKECGLHSQNNIAELNSKPNAKGKVS